MAIDLRTTSLAMAHRLIAKTLVNQQKTGHCDYSHGSYDSTSWKRSKQYLVLKTILLNGLIMTILVAVIENCE